MTVTAALDGTRSACRSCRRPIFYAYPVGWIHGELPQYAHEPITCQTAHPAECKHRIVDPCPLEASDA